MRPLSITARLYILSVILIGILTLGLHSPEVRAASLSDLIFAAAAALSITIALIHRIPVSHRIDITVTAGIAFAIILLQPFAWAIWTTMLGTALAYGYLNLYLRRWPWYNGAFNVGAHVITAATSAFVYQNLAGSSVFLRSPQNVMAVMAAGITYICVNTGLVALVIAVREGRNLWHTWVSGLEKTGPEYVTLILLGTLTAVAYNYHWWTISLMILPLVIVYHSLRTSQELRVQTIEAVKALADTMDARDPYTFEHSRRIVEYAEGVARELGLPADEIEIIKLSARVHDLGKIGIRDDVLNKKGTYTQEERLTMQQHVRIGAEIVGRFPRYKEGRDIILYHHEHYNGSGYLEGLRGDEIPIGARIIAVADAYDAMTTDRPYRKAVSQAEAIKELQRCSGTQFDPIVVGAFLKYLDKAEKAGRRSSEAKTKPAPSHT